MQHSLVKILDSERGGMKLGNVINYQSEFMRYKSEFTLKEVFQKTKWKFLMEFSMKGRGVSRFNKFFSNFFCENPFRIIP